MLYPQSNVCRQTADLSGFWDFRSIPPVRAWSGVGAGFDPAEIIAVPASWNDQFTDWRDYTGVAWYQTRFDLPWAGAVRGFRALQRGELSGRRVAERRAPR